MEFNGKLTKEGIERIETGIVLGDGTQCKPAHIDVLSDRSLHITIEEGKYHQVKRMIGAAGGEVTYLKRLSIGHITLDGIEAINTYSEIGDQDVVDFKNSMKIYSI